MENKKEICLNCKTKLTKKEIKEFEGICLKCYSEENPNDLINKTFC